MNPKWVVTTATERVALDESRNGEVTFTVTNQSNRNARAVFDIRAGDGVDESWFTIDDPQRPIRPAASVPYLVKIHAGAHVPPGTYEIAGRVYPPDTAPEESFVLSRRVLVEVPAPPAPPAKKFPWWILVAAALLVLVIGIVTWLVWPSGAEPAPPPEPTPSVSAAPAAFVTVPKLIGLTPKDAVAALEKAGFMAGTVQYRADAAGVGHVARQSLPVNTQAAQGSRINLEVTAVPGKPVISSPNNGSSVKPNTMPTVVWTQTNSWVSKWMVTVLAEWCVRLPLGNEQCQPAHVGASQVVTAREHKSPLPKLQYAANPQGWRHNGWIIVQVQPLDDFGNLSEHASIRVYLEH